MYFIKYSEETEKKLLFSPFLSRCVYPSRHFLQGRMEHGVCARCVCTVCVHGVRLCVFDAALLSVVDLPDLSRVSR